MALIKEIYINPLLVDASQKLKLSAFFSLFQDIATENADMIGLGKSVITDKGLDWIIMRVKVDFYGEIKHGDKVNLYTYPGELRNGFIFVRYGGINDLKGKPLCRITSLWGLIDNKSRRMVLKTTLPYPCETMNDNPLPFPDRIPVEEVEKVYSKTMRYSDCDLNGHVNNTKYIDMICDIFPLDFYINHMISAIDINYLSELHDGDNVDICASVDKTYIEGRVNDKPSFSAKIKFN